MSLRHAALLFAAMLPIAASATIVSDQIGPPVFVKTNWALPNETITNNLPASWTVFDDFTMTATFPVMNYLEIVAVGTGLNSPKNVAQWQATGPWRLTIYTDQAGKPGSAILQFIYITGMFTAQQVNYTIGTSPNCLLRFPTGFFLAPGTYWFNIVPENTIGSGVNYGFAPSTFPGFPSNNNAWLHDPFNTATFFPTGLNLAFRVDAI